MLDLTFRTARQSDWPAVAGLLEAASLPLAGAHGHLGGFLLAFRGDALIGTAGLEQYGDAALLRSIAVAEAERGARLGQDLVRRLLDQAFVRGITTVGLLTTTARHFFPRFGFRQVPLYDLPPALQDSAELRGACPASSVAMLLDLPIAAPFAGPAAEFRQPNSARRAPNQ